MFNLFIKMVKPINSYIWQPHSISSSQWIGANLLLCFRRKIQHLHRKGTMAEDNTI